MINTGANGLQRLDYVVKSAETYGIKLIINFVNNWSDYGGMPAYNTYYGTTKTTWYTDSRVQAQYKAYISAVVSRYKTSEAIFAWELANEPRCNGCATSVITNWATTISAYIKSLDSTHLVTLGDEGFMNGGGDGSYPYTVAEGIDFQANLKVANLDFGTFHLYPDSCKFLATRSCTPANPIRGRIIRLGQRLDQKPWSSLRCSKQTLHPRRVRHNFQPRRPTNALASERTQLSRCCWRHVLATR